MPTSLPGSKYATWDPDIRGKSTPNDLPISFVTFLPKIVTDHFSSAASTPILRLALVVSGERLAGSKSFWL